MLPVCADELRSYGFPKAEWVSQFASDDYAHQKPAGPAVERWSGVYFVDPSDAKPDRTVPAASEALMTAKDRILAATDSFTDRERWSILKATAKQDNGSLRMFLDSGRYRPLLQMAKREGWP